MRGRRSEYTSTLLVNWLCRSIPHSVPHSFSGFIYKNIELYTCVTKSADVDARLNNTCLDSHVLSLFFWCQSTSLLYLMEQCTLPEHNLMFCCNYAELCELCYVGINCSILHLETWLVSLGTFCIWTAVLLVTISPTSHTVKVFSKSCFNQSRSSQYYYKYHYFCLVLLLLIRFLTPTVISWLLHMYFVFP